jgi:hypothetical protein
VGFAERCLVQRDGDAIIGNCFGGGFTWHATFDFTPRNGTGLGCVNTGGNFAGLFRVRWVWAPPGT